MRLWVRRYEWRIFSPRNSPVREVAYGEIGLTHALKHWHSVSERRSAVNRFRPDKSASLRAFRCLTHKQPRTPPRTEAGADNRSRNYTLSRTRFNPTKSRWSADLIKNRMGASQTYRRCTSKWTRHSTSDLLLALSSGSSATRNSQ